MDFQTAVKTCFNKYADFNGTASLSEFWWFALFTSAVGLVLNIFGMWMIYGLFSLATLVPSLAVAARRLHDTDRSGWMQLLLLIPVIGWIVLLVFYIQNSVRPSRYAVEQPQALTL